MLEQLDIAIGFTVVMLLLSLLITVVVQAVSALFDLRGRNLVWGLTKLFHQLDPEFQKRVGRDWNELRSSVGKKLAEAVAMHPMLAHHLSGRAKAVRVDELLTVLEDLAKDPPQKMDEDAKRVLQDWARKIAPTPEAISVAETLRARIDEALPGHTAELRRLVEQAIGTAGRLQAGVERRFDEIMERTSDVFLRWTKAITIAGAFVLALGFHVDALDIYRQISASAAVRARLGSLADETTKKASDVFALDSNRIAAASTNVQAKHGADERAKALAKMPTFHTCGGAADWMVAKVDAGVIDEFTTACQQQALEQLGNVGASLSSLKASLNGSGLSLTSGDCTDAKAWWESYAHPKRSSWLAHLFGVIAAAFLLSLGGPFWYNTLRQLCSLKPATARKIDNEQRLKETTEAEAQVSAQAVQAKRAST